MKKAFAASLFYQGLRGGALYVTQDAVLYKNQTATLPSACKNIVMPFADIVGLEQGGSPLFPTVCIRLKDGRQYRYLIFARRRFLQALQGADTR